MIFNRGNRLTKLNSPFKFGNLEIEQTRLYTYLGIPFMLDGKFKHAQSELRKKALKAWFSLKRTIDTSAISIKSCFVLFDALILPIITYACQTWSSDINFTLALISGDPDQVFKSISIDLIEKFHLQFLKWTLNVHKKASNLGTLGDTGRYPLSLAVLKQTINYYHRVKNLVSHSSLVHKAFLEQQNLSLDWHQNISSL